MALSSVYLVFIDRSRILGNVYSMYEQQSIGYAVCLYCCYLHSLLKYGNTASLTGAYLMLRNSWISFVVIVYIIRLLDDT